MSDEKQPAEDKEIQDNELDEVSGGAKIGYADRHGGGVTPDHGGGIDPEMKVGGW
ncbi:MAG: hypothetical protein JO104_01030 [Candidatus Eremiobacteraeota bacterium]|nr:hypothetical protein [Candidatus Eremiobacteraeota bacterium]